VVALAQGQAAETPHAAAPPAPSRARRRAEPPTVAVQGNLFVPSPPPVSSETAQQTDWIGGLLGSAVCQTQRRLAGRVAPNDGVVETFLQALDAHHDRMTRPGLAQALGQPEFRLRGLLAGLQRLLNVDGYQVVAVDETAGTIELNRQLLNKQFEWVSP
jgi:hypothetical protein